MSRYNEQQGGGDGSHEGGSRSTYNVGPYQSGGHRYTQTRTSTATRPPSVGPYQHAANRQDSYRLQQGWQSQANPSHGPASRDSGGGGSLSGGHASPTPISGGGSAPTHGGYSGAAPLESPTNPPLTWQQQQQQHAETLEAPDSQPLTWRQEQQSASPSDVPSGQPLTWQQELHQKELPLPASDDIEVPMAVEKGGGGVHAADVGGRRYPHRPGAPVCRPYMLAGFCRFGMACRNHHPPEFATAAQSQQGLKGSAPATGANQNSAVTSAITATASSSGMAPSGQLEFVELDGHRLPVRPGKKPCPGLGRLGLCKYGMKCFFNHSPELVAAALKRRQKDGDQPETEAAAAVGNAGAAQGEGAEEKGEAGQEAETTAALSELLGAVDRVWPPVDHDRSPQSWALSRLTKFILIRAAWHVKKAASPPSSAAATHEPKGVAAMLAMGGLSSVASTRLAAADLLRSGSGCGGAAVALTSIGAELGPSWRADPKRAAATPFEVKIGPLIRTDPLANQVLIYELKKVPEVWVSLRLEALMRLGGLIAAAPRAAPGITAAATVATTAAARRAATIAAAASAPPARQVVAPLAEGAAPIAPSPRLIIALPASVTRHLSIATRPAPAPTDLPTAASPSSAPAAAKPMPLPLCELLVSGEGWETELRPYSPPPAGPGGTDGRRKSVPEAMPVPLVVGSSGGAQPAVRDDAVWDLLALLPRGLASLVEPYCWRSTAGSDAQQEDKVLTSVTIAAFSGPTVLRFLGGGRLLLPVGITAPGEDAPLQEALARLGDCERLIQVQLRDLEAADPTPGSADLPGSWWIDDEGAEEAEEVARSGSVGPFQPGVDAVLIPGTLHRVAAMRDGLGDICGLTYRIGRQPGAASASSASAASSSSGEVASPPPAVRCPALILADVLAAAVGAASSSSALQSSRSAPSLVADAATTGSGPLTRGLLLVGPTGSGKTTLLRALTRAAALHLNKAVLVLDNSWELGGMRLPASDNASPPVSAPVADLGPGTQRVCLHHLVQQHQASGSPPTAIAHAVASALAAHSPDVVVMDDVRSALDVAVAAALGSRGIAVLAAASHAPDLQALARSGELSAACGLMGPEQAAAAAIAAAMMAAQSESAAAAPATAVSPPPLLLPPPPLQRMGLPIFGSLVELLHGPRAVMRVHPDLSLGVGGLAAGAAAEATGAAPKPWSSSSTSSELRYMSPCGRRLLIQREAALPTSASASASALPRQPSPALPTFHKQQQQATPAGTRGATYQPTPCTELEDRAGVGKVAMHVRYTTITAMPAFKGRSQEELRWADQQEEE